MGSKLRVLVVDDDRTLLRAVVRVLRRFEVTPCATVAEANRALEEAGPFDAVVSDVQIGGHSGIAWFHEVAANHPETAARFVFISGAADDPVIRPRLDETARPYMVKPFPVLQFIELVAALAESREPRSTHSGGYRIGKKIPHV